ncbi:large ribosomal subunit protein mL63-like [Ptychodera flava]|uniref:large ribosomal subunit protein mL63-like n=1 Tax=Ptychodera flava TaxID=63121 RepID=UPI003969EEDF
MWLTRLLLAHRPLGRKVPGLQWTGKHRRPRIITKFMMRNLQKRLEREAENDRLLSRPFLTHAEQVEDHKLSSAREQVEIDKIKEARIHTLPEHKTMDTHFDHLNVTRRWGDQQ